MDHGIGHMVGPLDIPTPATIWTHPPHPLLVASSDDHLRLVYFRTYPAPPSATSSQRVCSTVKEEAVYLTMLSAVTPTL